MKQALNQSKELESSKYEQMIKLAQAYSDNRELSVQEAVYQLMPELWLKKDFLLFLLSVQVYQMRGFE